MNILLFSRIVAKSGVGNHMKQLSEELVRKGHNVCVMSSTNELGIGEGNSQVEFVYLTPISLNPVAIIKGIKKLHQTIKDNKIELVHCHHRMAALYMKFYRFFYKIPMVYTLHLADVPADFMHRKMTYVGDKAIGVSTEVSDFLVNKLLVPADKVTTIFNGVDEKQLTDLSSEERNEVYAKYDIPENRVIFVMHSRIDEVKNHMLVVDALKEMPKEYRNQLGFVCSGIQSGSYYERVKQKIEEYNLQDNFVFTGWIDTRSILGIADALVLPSTNEGFPLSVIEAFLMKVPVFRTRTGGFDDQKYCVEISQTDFIGLAGILMDFIDNKEKYTDISDMAYQYAMEEFTLEKMTDNTLGIYSVIK